MLAVLNPGGGDPARSFPDGAGSPSDRGHPPVNFHAYAACCRAGFYRHESEIPRDCARVIVLLRPRNLGEIANVVRRLKSSGKTVLISWKESGLFQVSAALARAARLQNFLQTCDAADGFIAATTDLTGLYEAAGCGYGKFVPTPYPVGESGWDFSVPLSERRGIFVGTREFDVPSRCHALALTVACRLGHPVTVINESWQGSSFLRRLPGNIEVVPRRLPYEAYLRLMARHRIVFQLDSSAVPGQVAGDALLCGVPCVGGNGAIERLVFPKLCGVTISSSQLAEIAQHLLSSDKACLEAVHEARELARTHVSFSVVSEKLLSVFDGVATASWDPAQHIPIQAP